MAQTITRYDMRNTTVANIDSCIKTLTEAIADERRGLYGAPDQSKIKKWQDAIENYNKTKETAKEIYRAVQEKAQKDPKYKGLLSGNVTAYSISKMENELSARGILVEDLDTIKKDKIKQNLIDGKDYFSGVDLGNDWGGDDGLLTKGAKKAGHDIVHGDNGKGFATGLCKALSVISIAGFATSGINSIFGANTVGTLIGKGLPKAFNFLTSAISSLWTFNPLATACLGAFVVIKAIPAIARFCNKAKMKIQGLNRSKNLAEKLKANVDYEGLANDYSKSQNENGNTQTASTQTQSGATQSQQTSTGSQQTQTSSSQTQNTQTGSTQTQNTSSQSQQTNTGNQSANTGSQQTNTGSTQTQQTSTENTNSSGTGNDGATNTGKKPYQSPTTRRIVENNPFPEGSDGYKDFEEKVVLIDALMERSKQKHAELKALLPQYNEETETYGIGVDNDNEPLSGKQVEENRQKLETDYQEKKNAIEIIHKQIRETCKDMLENYVGTYTDMKFVPENKRQILETLNSTILDSVKEYLDNNPSTINDKEYDNVMAAYISELKEIVMEEGEKNKETPENPNKELEDKVKGNSEYWNKTTGELGSIEEFKDFEQKLNELNEKRFDILLDSVNYQKATNTPNPNVMIELHSYCDKFEIRLKGFANTVPGYDKAESTINNIRAFAAKYHTMLQNKEYDKILEETGKDKEASNKTPKTEKEQTDEELINENPSQVDENKGIQLSDNVKKYLDALNKSKNVVNGFASNKQDKYNVRRLGFVLEQLQNGDKFSYYANGNNKPEMVEVQLNADEKDFLVAYLNMLSIERGKETTGKDKAPQTSTKQLYDNAMKAGDNEYLKNMTEEQRKLLDEMQFQQGK